MTDITTQIAENLPDPLFVFGGETNGLIWMNTASKAWLRKPFLSLQGKTISGLASEFTLIEDQIKHCALTQERYIGYDLPINLRRRDYLCQYKVFALGGGVAVLLSPRETGAGFNKADTQTQAVLMLGRMLAHELKNPLAGIRGAAQLLESEITDDDNLELTELIKTEVDRIGRLATQMETFGQTSDKKAAPLNIHEVLRKAGLLFQNNSNANIKIAEIYDPSLPLVNGDEDSLMQVFVNLIANAVEAIKSEGHADGEIRIVTGYRGGVRRRSPDNEVIGSGPMLPIEIKIIDNGPGIPAHLRERIFHPFVTSKANGQGLGLALISKIIDEHGGLIDVVSEPGCTVFTVLLPAQKA